jgi:hypothetical protein
MMASGGLFLVMVKTLLVVSDHSELDPHKLVNTVLDCHIKLEVEIIWKRIYIVFGLCAKARIPSDF